MKTLNYKFNKITSLPLLVNKLYKNMGIEPTKKYRNTIEAFKASMAKNFPHPDRLGWELISTYQASLILDQYITINTINRYRDLNLIRSKDKKLYREEIIKFKELLQSIESY
jgi:hypothetical protein